MKSYLTREDFEKVIYSLITSRLDGCNALDLGLDKSSVCQVLKKHKRVSPILASLSLLPVHFRMNFKILLLAFKALKALAPSYLCVLINIHTSVRSGRKFRGDRVFAVSAPSFWNGLRFCIQTADTVESLLKTHRYALAFILVEVEILLKPML